jgi:hypothetical protein
MPRHPVKGRKLRMMERLDVTLMEQMLPLRFSAIARPHCSVWGR